MSEETEQRELVTFVISAGDKSGRFASDFYDVYGDEYNFSQVEFTTTLHKAIQSLKEQAYDLCVMTEDFDEEDVMTFFSDFNKINEESGCIFVQVWKEFPEGFNPEEYKQLGFHGVITLQGTHADREALAEALKDWRHQEEINKRSVDVDSALNVLLRQIDKIASDFKRGVSKKLDNLPTEFINVQAEYDDEILNRYYQKLETKTADAEPENAKGVKIPQAILKKGLPNLEENNYTGASHRVWKRLLRKHGVDAPNMPRVAATEVPEEKTEAVAEEKTETVIEEQESTSPDLDALLEEKEPADAIEEMSNAQPDLDAILGSKPQE